MKKQSNYLNVDFKLLKTFKANEAFLLSLCLQYEENNEKLIKTNNEISELLGLPTATLNRTIKTLCDDGYIYRDRLSIKAYNNRKALATTNKLHTLLNN